jgi:hypothetical protein
MQGFLSSTEKGSTTIPEGSRLNTIEKEANLKFI